MEELTGNITVAAVLVFAADHEVTGRALLRLAADATEYAVIGLAVETTKCGALKLAADIG